MGKNHQDGRKKVVAGNERGDTEDDERRHKKE